MTGPKHLWAGDWQQESEAVERRDDLRDSPPPDLDVPGPQAGNRTRAPGRRRQLVLGLGVIAALALIAGVALGLSDSGGKPKHPSASQLASRARLPYRLTQPPQLPPGVPTIPQLTTPQPASPTGNPPQASSATTSGPAVYWLGMQIGTIGQGQVVIETVELGSEADRAALEPGEQLLAVNGHQLSSAADITSAIKGVPAGHRITVQVSYGSSDQQTVDLTLGAPPSRHP